MSIPVPLLHNLAGIAPALPRMTRKGSICTSALAPPREFTEPLARYNPQYRVAVIERSVGSLPWTLAGPITQDKCQKASTGQTWSSTTRQHLYFSSGQPLTIPNRLDHFAKSPEYSDQIRAIPSMGHIHQQSTLGRGPQLPVNFTRALAIEKRKNAGTNLSAD
jgi:hypothetical protein